MNTKQQKEIEKLREELRAVRYQNTCLMKQVNALKNGKELELPSYQETLVAKLRMIIETMYNVDISEDTRRANVIMARHLFHHWLCFNTSYTLNQIGGLLGLHLHHSTPIHSRNTIQDLLEYDKALQSDYAKICELMKTERVTDTEPIINAS